MPRPKRSVWLMVVGIAALAASLWIASSKIDLRPIDLGNYLRAGALLVEGRLPYGITEFFAPPWIGLLFALLLPLPVAWTELLWLAGSMVAICTAVALHLITIRFPARPSYRLLLVVASGLLPVSLYLYVTGQITAFVALAVVGLWLVVGRPSSPATRLAAVACVVLCTAKPHLVALPLGLCLMEMIRTRRWDLLVAVILGIASLFALTSLVYPGWLAAWVGAIAGADYLGGPGLAARGFRGYRELGISLVWFLPFFAYLVVRWARQGVTPTMLGLATTVGIMAIPYARAYDYVLLLPAAWTALAPGGRLRWGRWLLVWTSLTALSVSGLSLVVPPLICIALLLTQATGPTPRLPAQRSGPQAHDAA